MVLQQQVVCMGAGLLQMGSALGSQTAMFSAEGTHFRCKHFIPQTPQFSINPSLPRGDTSPSAH